MNFISSIGGGTIGAQLSPDLRCLLSLFDIGGMLPEDHSMIQPSSKFGQKVALEALSMAAMSEGTII